MRAFIAIDIGEKEEIIRMMEELSEIKGKMKIVEPQNIHMTLKFLGDINEDMIEKIRYAIEKSTENIEPFTAKLAGVGAFPSIDYIRVIWVGFKDDGQSNKIALRINEELEKYGFRREKEFVPHVTIARIKSKEGKEEIKNFIKKYSDTEFCEIECKSIKLKKSILRKEGPLYETIEEIRI